jgi:hypothetical protein
MCPASENCSVSHLVLQLPKREMRFYDSEILEWYKSGTARIKGRVD